MRSPRRYSQGTCGSERGTQGDPKFARRGCATEGDPQEHQTEEAAYKNHDQDPKAGDSFRSGRGWHLQRSFVNAFGQAERSR